MKAALEKANALTSGTVTISCESGKPVVWDDTHLDVARSMKIEGNGAYVVNKGSDGNPKEGQVTLAIDYNKKLTEDITLEIDSLHNFAVWGERSTSYTFNLVMKNCTSRVTGTDALKNGAEVYLSGSTGINNITLENCTFYSNSENCTVYSNANGTISISKCTFIGVYEPININRKAVCDDTKITISDCIFLNCGTGNGKDNNYAAPIRILNSGSEKEALSVKVDNCQFRYIDGKKSCNGDILIGEGRSHDDTGQRTTYKVLRNVENTTAEIQYQKPGYYYTGTDTTQTGDSTKISKVTLTSSQVMESNEVSSTEFNKNVEVTQGGVTTYYGTLSDAVNAAIASPNKATIKLLTNCNGSGIFIGKDLNADIAIDLGGYIFTCTGPAVGSTGYESQAFHLEKGSKVSVSNGTVTTSDKSVKMLFQNYCDLTLKDVKVIGTDWVQYVTSNNFGSMTVSGSTDITAVGDYVAFDIWYGAHSSYDGGVKVTFTDDFSGTVTGKMEYGAKNRIADNTDLTDKAVLRIGGNGTFFGDYKFTSSQTTKDIKITGGSFYKGMADLVKGGTYTPNAGYHVVQIAHSDSTECKVLPVEDFVEVGGQKFNSFSSAIAAAKSGTDKTVKFIMDHEFVNDSGTATFYDVSGLTIDLNDMTVTVQKLAMALIGTDFEITNGTLVGASYYDKNGAQKSVTYALFIGDRRNDGESGTKGSSTVTTSGVTISDLVVEGGINIYESTGVILKDLTVHGMAYYAVWCETTADSGRTASVTIESGQYTMGSGGSVIGGENSSSLFVKGGAYDTTNVEKLVYVGDGSIKPTLTGGFFCGDNTSDTEISNYVSGSYCVVSATQGGKSGYSVVQAVASITISGETTYYPTLAEAVGAVGSDVSNTIIIKILADTDCVGKNGKKITFEPSAGVALKHVTVTDSYVSPTCSSIGWTEGSHCSRCDAVLKAQTMISTTSHSWDSGTVTKEATETSEGVKTYKCSNCSATKTESIPKLTCTHTWDSGTVTQEATCGAAGSKTLTCTKCGETKTETIAATGNHSWDSGTVVREPTTTESGTTEYKCSVCGQTKTATIEPKKTEVEEKDGVKTTTDTTKTVEKGEDGSETTTETTIVSKEENGKVVEKVETTKSTTEKDGTTIVSESTVTEKDGQTEKVETTKSTTQTEDTVTVAESTLTEKNGQLVEKIETTTSTTQTEDSTIVSETKVTEKAGEATEKVETVTATTQKEGATIVAETKVTEKGQEKTETIAVSIGSDDGSVKTDVSVSDGTTSGIETVISGDVTDDTIAHAIKQADMATEAISDKVSDVSKNISVPSDNVTLSPTSLGALADSGSSLTITGDAGSIGIDAKVTGTMMSRNEDVTISISEKKTGLTDEQKQKAGENKVIELSAKSATEDIHELGGTAKVRIDMTGMDLKSPAVYWLKDDGSSERVDAEFGEGYAAIELNHFSLYYIAETAQESENSTVMYVAIAVIIIAILAIAGVVMYKRKTA